MKIQQLDESLESESYCDEKCVVLLEGNILDCDLEMEIQFL